MTTNDHRQPATAVPAVPRPTGHCAQLPGPARTDGPQTEVRHPRQHHGHERPAEAPLRVLGLDAYALGWVGIELRDGTFSRAVLASTLYQIVTGSSGIAVIGVDIPLGMLPDRWRTADALAAEQLGPRRASISRIPPRQVWHEQDFAAADKLCRELTGVALSRQTWVLRLKVLEVNAIGQRHPGLLFEAHPEVSFRMMAGEPLPYAENTWTGQMHRRDLLARNGIVLPDDLGPPGQAPPDDILDAAAVAWTAHRMATGAAGSYPNPPEETGDGSPIAIWF
jgi:predicted RNase H-like nuclease